jgi:hypothetical protein
MLVRQNKYYDNLTYIENAEEEDNDYGYFCELEIDYNNNRDIENPEQKSITNYNKYYVYNYNYNPKKNDDIKQTNDIIDNKHDTTEKYNDIYFLIHLCLITSTGCILMYFTIKSNQL